MEDDSGDPKYLPSITAIVVAASRTEQERLLEWAQGLREIRRSDGSALKKGWAAVQFTRERKVIAPLLRIFVQELKRLGWDERSWIGKLGIGGMSLTLLTLGGASGGFAAFGTAVAVPLWLVAGGGGVLLGLLIEKLKANLTSKPPSTQK